MRRYHALRAVTLRCRPSSLLQDVPQCESILGGSQLFYKACRLESIPDASIDQRYVTREMSSAKQEVPRIKLQLDNAWRAEKDGTPVVDGAAKSVDELQNRVISQAAEDANRDQQALGEMSKKTIGQATGPTAAPSDPEQPPRRREQASSSSRSHSSSSTGSSSSSRRGRSRHRKRRGPRRESLSPPPEQWIGRRPQLLARNVAQSPSRDDSAKITYKVKFAPVVDDMMFDSDLLMTNIPKATMTSPTMIEFTTAASECLVVEKLDSIIPERFRVYYKKKVFRICPAIAAQPPRSAAEQPRRRHRHRPKAKAASPAVPPRLRAARVPPAPKAPSQKPVYNSGVLSGTRAISPPPGLEGPYNVWPLTGRRRPWVRRPPAPQPRQLSAVGQQEVDDSGLVPRPKKQARAASWSSAPARPKELAALFRSIANVLSPKPSAAPEGPIDIRMLKDTTDPALLG